MSHAIQSHSQQNQHLPQSPGNKIAAANDCKRPVPAAEVSINEVRNMLGRNSAASQYDKLTQQQKAMILFAARLKPSEYISKPLMSLTPANRDAVRKAIIAMQDAAKAFGNLSLAKEQFISKPLAVKQPAKAQTVAAKTIAAKPAIDDVDESLREVSALARALALEVAEVTQ